MGTVACWPELAVLSLDHPMRPVGLDRQSTRRRASPRLSGVGAAQPATEPASPQHSFGQPLAVNDDAITGQALEAGAEAHLRPGSPKVPALQSNLMRRHQLTNRHCDVTLVRDRGVMRSVSGRHHRWIDVSIGMHIPVDWRLDPWRGDLRRRDACAGTHRTAATDETVTVGCEKLPGRLRRQGEEIDLYAKRQSLIARSVMRR